jgi:hypothetical protein
MQYTKNKTPIRFFAISCDLDIVEVSLETFKCLTGEITKEVHTVFENGCNQICYTIENDEAKALPDFEG